MTSEYITYKYNAKFDVMHVFMTDKYKDADYGWYVADEVADNINEIRDERNEDLVGFLILDYRRNKPELVKRYPEYFSDGGILLIYWLLFFEFAKISLVCVGGGYASMPLIQAAVVDTYHWLSLSEFIDIFTISQMTPGPIGINAATFAGMKIAGIGGAICATMGFVTPSIFLCIALAKIIFKYGDLGAIHGILNGLRPAVMALIAAACVSFVLLAVWNAEKIPDNFLTTFDWKGAVILIGALVAVRMKIGVIKVLLASGVAGLILGLLVK